MKMELTNFNAEMSVDELADGELLHMEMEKYRRMVMVSGLTKSSDELRNIIDQDPRAYIDMLKLSLSSFEHYSNLLELLIGGTERLFILASESGLEKSDTYSEEVMNRVASIIAKSLKQTQVAN